MNTARTLGGRIVSAPATVFALAMVLVLVSDARPASAGDDPAVTVVELSKQKVLVKKLSAAPTELQGKVRKAVTDATNAARRLGLDIAGPPVVRYVERTPTRFVVEAGVPVQGATPALKNRPDLRLIELPAGKAATITHVGPYEKLPLTHAALDRWLATQKKKPSGQRWEVFVSNPVVVRDVNKRETKIFAPLE